MIFPTALRRFRVLFLAAPALLLLGVFSPLVLYRLRPAKLPLVTRLSPAAGLPGEVIRITVEGEQLDKVDAVLWSRPAASWRLLPPRWRDRLSFHRRRQVRLEVRFPEAARPGVYYLRLANRAGGSAALPFLLGTLPAPRQADRSTPPADASLPPGAYREVEPNDYPPGDHPFTLPFKVVGCFDREGDVDSYCFRAAAGDEVGVKLSAYRGPEPRALMQLTDPDGRCLVHSTSGFLGYRCARAGTYAVRLRELTFRGDPSAEYLLEVGGVPVVTGVYPLGLQRGTAAEFRLDGVNLGPMTSFRLEAGLGFAVGDRLPVAFGTPHGPALCDRRLIVGEFPEVSAEAQAAGDEHGPARCGTLPVPGTANGRVGHPSGDLWRIAARRGRPLVLEVHAQRLGSPLDSVLEVLDELGRPIPRATLRCVARADTDMDMDGSFDSETAVLGVTDWAPFHGNDYVFIGSELARLRSIPNHPNDHARFYTVDGKRATYLDTTATYHHRTGVPVYKVEVCAPGTAVAPTNGLPVFTLPYRNDDGGPYVGKDSRLAFDPPSDGEYLVRVSDVHGRSGADFAYRLTARPPRPDFLLRASVEDRAGQRGGTIPVKVVVERQDGFNGPVAIRLDGLPPGFRSSPGGIAPDDDSTTMALECEPSAPSPSSGAGFRVVARAEIDGQPVVREAAVKLPAVRDPESVTVTTRQPELRMKPGRRGELTVTVGRVQGFTDAVSLQVLGLPPGIEVVGIGGSGIVIPEGQTSRTLVFEADPRVAPLTQPVVVRVNHERFRETVVATSVLLRVKAKE